MNDRPNSPGPTPPTPPTPPPTPGIVLYTPPDGGTSIAVRLEGQSAWLTQAQMGELFQTTPQHITMHVANVYADGELPEGATCKELLQVRAEGGRTVERATKHYSLDMIIAVGYRVRSARGTQFRQWATATLAEYLTKGFVLDDRRLKEGKNWGADYFDELLARIRDIRASERRFYQKITDIYATSIDYDPKAAITQEFYATVQNKLHWAITGHTAAETIVSRADADKPNMGLTTWKNAPKGPVRKADIGVATASADGDEEKPARLGVSLAQPAISDIEASVKTTALRLSTAVIPRRLATLADRRRPLSPGAPSLLVAAI